MNIEVRIVYKDDTEAIYQCTDEPFTTDWIMLRLEDGSKKLLPLMDVKEINWSVVNRLDMIIRAEE